MAAVELIGWLAAVLTLLALRMRRMVPLRVAAPARTYCVIGYGVLTELSPVIVLPAVLVPCNLLRLHELLRPARAPSGRRGRVTQRRWSTVRATG